MHDHGSLVARRKDEVAVQVAGNQQGRPLMGALVTLATPPGLSGSRRRQRFEKIHLPQSMADWFLRRRTTALDEKRTIGTE
jgi:hypothetical protein